jgi:hypothetical protein
MGWGVLETSVQYKNHYVNLDACNSIQKPPANVAANNSRIKAAPEKFYDVAF